MSMQSTFPPSAQISCPLPYVVQVGFRQVELGDRALLVNKRRIWVRGVNRHEHDPLRGKAVSEASMLQVPHLPALVVTSCTVGPEHVPHVP
jgi:Glycosyl hydrolases family 2, TIM barrel domain